MQMVNPILVSISSPKSVLHFSVISDKLGLLSTYCILVLDQEPRTKCIKNFYYSRVCHCTGILLIWLGTQMSFFLYQHLMLSTEAAMLEINWPCRSLCCCQQVLLLVFFPFAQLWDDICSICMPFLLSLLEPVLSHVYFTSPNLQG